MKNSLIIKKADISDIIEIRIWRNNKVTRINSFNKNYIDHNEHAKWFFETFFNNKKLLYIGINKNNYKIGVTKLDEINKKLVEVSININPNFRKSGYGQILLYETVKKAFEKNSNIKILSRILKRNYKSIELFKKLGFKLSARRIDSFEYILDKKSLKRL